jgi:hypothetical protein
MVSFNDLMKKQQTNHTIHSTATYTTCPPLYACKILVLNDKIIWDNVADVCIRIRLYAMFTTDPL